MLFGNRISIKYIIQITPPLFSMIISLFDRRHFVSALPKSVSWTSAGLNVYYPGGTVKNQPDSPPAELPTRPSCTLCMPTCRHAVISSLVAVATGEFSRTRTSAGKNVVSCGFPYGIQQGFQRKEYCLQIMMCQ
ncbi:uncharacterized protein LOC128212504 [Mya arenaria]|uniref:uncharacterized protein LOC128212458 n=1 Tax=Mya arenaria TaxID=6604 RepID=UPI0022E83EB2|nr:uncharacterized protein LOC128212458 [Mya arenaria]XP_052773947.1 uncharacterized protein LOC128212504 [Mya arenaria]